MEKRFLVNRESYDYGDKGAFSTSFSDDYNDFENKYNTFYEGLFEEGEIYIPITVFSAKIGCFQAIIKFLKDKEALKYSEIAKLVNRDQRTIWSAYNQAKDVFVKVEDTDVFIPISIIADRKFSVLESIILHLKDQGFSFNEIAFKLKRNYQTVYTTHRKARRKVNE